MSCSWCKPSITDIIAFTAGECCEHRHPSATIHWRNSKHQRQRTPPELCWCNQWFAITGQSWQELQKQGGEGGGGGPGEENEEEGGGGEKEREGTVSIWQGHPSPSHGMSHVKKSHCQEHDDHCESPFRCERTNCFKSRQKSKPSKREAPRGSRPLKTGQMTLHWSPWSIIMTTISGKRKRQRKCVGKRWCWSCTSAPQHLQTGSWSRNQTEIKKRLEIVKTM